MRQRALSLTVAFLKEQKKGCSIIKNMHYSVQYPDGLGSSVHFNHCNCTSGSINSAATCTNLFWNSIDNSGMTSMPLFNTAV